MNVWVLDRAGRVELGSLPEDVELTVVEPDDPLPGGSDEVELLVPGDPRESCWRRSAGCDRCGWSRRSPRGSTGSCPGCRRASRCAAEPLPLDHPLWRPPGVLITPHLAGDTREAERRAYALVAHQVRHYARGEPLRNVVTSGY